MRLIVGLGNPEDKYKDTRHNAGFMLIDALAKSRNLFWEKSEKLKSFVCRDIAKNELLAKPTTFMNASGDALKALTDFYQVDVDKLWVAHDDLDLRLGECKIQKAKGPKEHNGIVSVEEKLGSAEFWRIRIGVDTREGERDMPGEKYVLQKFSEDELKKIKATIEQIINGL